MFDFNFNAKNIHGLFNIPNEGSSISRHLAIATHDILNNIEDYSYIDDNLNEGLHIGRVFERCIRGLSEPSEILGAVSMIDDIMISIMRSRQYRDLTSQ